MQPSHEGGAVYSRCLSRYASTMTIRNRLHNTTLDTLLFSTLVFPFHCYAGLNQSDGSFFAALRRASSPTLT